MTHDQDLARRLGETLHRRADALHDTPLDLMDVRGRATTIRRRRHTAVGLAAAAAVAAVVLPLSLLPTGGDDGVVDPQPVDTPTPTRIEDTVPLDPRSAPEGPPARISYVDSDRARLVTPDGTDDLPEAYRQIVPFADGWVAISTAEPSPTGSRLAVLDPSYAARLDPVVAGPLLAVSDDGSRVAWVEWDEDDSSWVVVHAASDGSQTSHTYDDLGPVDAMTSPVGFLRGDQVVVETTDTETFRPSYRVMDAAGTAPVQIPGFNRVTGTSSVSGLVGGQTEFLGDGSCSGVLDPLSADRGLVWETCDHSLGAFSPDGRYVVGLAPYYDGPGSPTVGILDAATGEPLVEFASSNDPASVATVGDAAWEDDTTLLATVNQGAEEFLVRLTADGRVERLDAMPDPGQENARFWFAAGPYS